MENNLSIKVREKTYDQLRQMADEQKRSIITVMEMVVETAYQMTHPVSNPPLSRTSKKASIHAHRTPIHPHNACRPLALPAVHHAGCDFHQHESGKAEMNAKQAKLLMLNEMVV